MSRIDNFSLLKNLDHRRQWSPRSAKLLRKCFESHGCFVWLAESHTHFSRRLVFLGCACKIYLVIYPTSNPQVCRESSSYLFLNTGDSKMSLEKRPRNIESIGEELLVAIQTPSRSRPNTHKLSTQEKKRRYYLLQCNPFLTSHFWSDYKATTATKTPTLLRSTA